MFKEPIEVGRDGFADEGGGMELKENESIVEDVGGSVKEEITTTCSQWFYESDTEAYDDDIYEEGVATTIAIEEQIAKKIQKKTLREVLMSLLKKTLRKEWMSLWKK